MIFEVFLMTMKAPIQHLYLLQLKHVILHSNHFVIAAVRFPRVEVAQILVMWIAVTASFSIHHTWRNANGIRWLTDKHHIKQACCSLQVKVTLLKMNTIFWKHSFRLRIITTVCSFSFNVPQQSKSIACVPIWLMKKQQSPAHYSVTKNIHSA